MSKVKKQHYVPQGYLKNFACKNSDSVFVFDKEAKRSWRAAISDTAAERYFNDLYFDELLNDESLELLQSLNISLEQLHADQTVEKYLANKIETEYAKLLTYIITSFRSLTPWKENNCFFISKKDKEELSYYLAVQMLRTRASRDSILDSADRMQQILTDMGVYRHHVERFGLSEKQAANIQGEIVLNSQEMRFISYILNQLTWVLCINRSSQLLFTSDNPIARVPHAKQKHEFISMSGLTSPGIELSIPISPNLLLLMIDAKYHNLPKSIDRNWQVMGLENAQHYNARCVYQSHRFVYSSINDFSLILDIAKKDPTIFECGTQDVSFWGDKAYKSRRLSK